MDFSLKPLEKEPVPAATQKERITGYCSCGKQPMVPYRARLPMGTSDEDKAAPRCE